VREDLVRDLRKARKDAADVEHVGNRTQQFDRGFDAGSAASREASASR
jgi:hypothetical protein